MIIYGTKATEIATKKITGECPNCKTQNSIQMAAFQRYAHVFWIPVIPIGKIGVTECAHCKQVLTQQDFKGMLKERYEKMIAEANVPYWAFSGLALVVVGITIAIITGQQKSARNAELILQPQKGDIYEIKIEDRYTLYKVEMVSNDTIFLLTNMYETDKAKGLTELKRKGEYSAETGMILKNDLKALFDKGTILNIDRQ